MTKGERGEDLIHIEAFEYYYAMGKSRTLQKVADHFDRSVATLQHWSHWYDWRKRIKDRENEIARRLAEEVISEAVKDRRQYQLLLKAMIGKGYEDFKAGVIKPATVTDLINLMRMEIVLTESTDDLTRRMTYQGPSITREISMREVITGGGEFEYDDEMARRISEAIIESAARPVEGDGGEDEPRGLAAAEEGPDEQLASQAMVRDSGEREDTEGVHSSPEGPLQVGDFRGEPAELEDALYPESLDATLQPDFEPSGRVAGPGSGSDDAGGASDADGPEEMESEGQATAEQQPGDEQRRGDKR